jgi:protein involved in polysaccharide export with SLBB domain
MTRRRPVLPRVNERGFIRAFVACAIALAVPLAFAAAQASSANGGAARVRPGDRLVVKFLDEPALLTDTLMVNGRGVVVLPRLGAVDVSAFLIDDLPDSLRIRYTKFLRSPSVDVRVLRRIVLNGEVKKPDVYLVDARTTVSDAIAHAGGLSDNAKPDHVWIVRDGQEIPIRDWNRAGASLPELHSGDAIIVGRKSWFSMNFLPAVSTVALIASVVVTLLRK